MNTKLVLDVSKYNSATDYNAAAAAVDGVIMRVGYRGYGTSGTIAEDTLFQTHYNGFAGKTKIGYYFFTTAINETEARAEADWVVGKIRDKYCDFPIYIDTEYSNATHDGRSDGLSQATRTSVILAFCNRIKELGYRAGIYASDSWFINQLNWNLIKDSGNSIWDASYSAAPSRVSWYDGWQYTSTGAVNGVTGNVDLSYFYNDVAGWESSTPDITNANIILSSTVFVYNGTSQVPTVTVSYNGINLIQGTDYSVTFPADSVSVGEKIITINGLGKYIGSKNVSYYMITLPIDLGTIHLDETSFEYNGSIQKPIVSVVYDDGTVLTEGRDYIVSFPEDKINVGTKQITVNGNLSFEGSISTNYYITPKSLNVVDITCGNPDEDGCYNIENLQVSKDGVKIIENTDYTKTITYSTREEFRVATVTITGKGNYDGSCTNSFNVAINYIDISTLDIRLTQNSFKYSASLIQPEINTTLIKEIDYTVEYRDNLTAGIGKVILTGIGKYINTKTLTFNIEKTSVNDLFKYNCGQPDSDGCYDINNFTVSCQLEQVVKDKDFILSFKEYINKSKKKRFCEITITGIGNYKDSTIANYPIYNMKSVIGATITCGEPDNDGCYNLSNIKVEKDDSILIPNQDYSTEINIITEQRQKIANITIKGINNYLDEIGASYKIEKIPVEIPIDSIHFECQNEFTFTGYDIEPKIYTELTEYIDYRVEYRNNINVGTAEIIIYGKGDYVGSITLTFTILPKNINLSSMDCGAPDKYNCYDLNKLVVNLDGIDLSKDVDYFIESISISSNTKYYVSEVTISGIGNYTGSRSKSFNTEKIFIDINSIDMSINDYSYTGDYIIPTIKTVLKEYIDYTVSYIGNKNVGKCIAYIIGKGDYNNTRYLEFNILPLDLTEAIVSCGEPDDDGCYDLSNLIVIYNDRKLIKNHHYYTKYTQDIGEHFKITHITILPMVTYFTGTIEVEYPTARTDHHYIHPIFVATNPGECITNGSVEYIGMNPSFPPIEDEGSSFILIDDRLKIQNKADVKDWYRNFRCIILKKNEKEITIKSTNNSSSSYVSNDFNNLIKNKDYYFSVNIDSNNLSTKAVYIAGNTGASGNWVQLANVGTNHRGKKQIKVKFNSGDYKYIRINLICAVERETIGSEVNFSSIMLATKDIDFIPFNGDINNAYKGQLQDIERKKTKAYIKDLYLITRRLIDENIWLSKSIKNIKYLKDHDNDLLIDYCSNYFIREVFKKNLYGTDFEYCLHAAFQNVYVDENYKGSRFTDYCTMYSIRCFEFVFINLIRKAISIYRADHPVDPPSPEDIRYDVLKYACNYADSVANYLTSTLLYTISGKKIEEIKYKAIPKTDLSAIDVLAKSFAYTDNTIYYLLSLMNDSIIGESTVIDTFSEEEYIEKLSEDSVYYESLSAEELKWLCTSYIDQIINQLDIL